MNMTPKMQLAPGDYVTEAFRAETNAWLIDFFGYEEDSEPAYTNPVVTGFNDSKLQATTKKTTKKERQDARRKRTQLPPDMETFSALLEGLDDSFYSLQVPPIAGSFLSKREVNSIKKIGVYIPTPFAIEVPVNPVIDADIRLPMIASALMIPRKAEHEHTLNPGMADMMCPRFAYALKGAALPARVEMTKGVPYQFGVCFEMKRDEAGKEMKPKLFWAWCWIVVRPDRSIRIPHEMRAVVSQITHKQTLPGYKGRGSHSSSLHTRNWCLPTLAIAEKGLDQMEHEHMMCCTFRQLLKWWAAREHQWSVGVRKDGHRVTFGIEKEHTSGYFADRNTVVNVDGKPRKIVHFVREHERVTGATVKAHIRGLREFDWKGYHCTVTVPGMKGSIFTNFTLDPVLLGRSEEKDGYLDTDVLAEKLATLEDAVE